MQIWTWHVLQNGTSLTCAHQNDSLAPTFMHTYLHVHKQPFRVYLFRGHGGDLGLEGDLGTRRQGVGINMYINNHLGLSFRGHGGGLGVDAQHAKLMTCWSNMQDSLDAILKACWRSVEDAQYATLRTCWSSLENALDAMTLTCREKKSRAQTRQIDGHKRGRIQNFKTLQMLSQMNSGMYCSLKCPYTFLSPSSAVTSFAKILPPKAISFRIASIWESTRFVTSKQLLFQTLTRQVQV